MKSLLIVYGISNCDTTQKALAWLRAHNITFRFHDYKKEGITKTKLGEWSKKISWEILLNKRGTTWKSLSPPVQQTLINEQSAIQLMQENTSLIKRPVIENGDKISVGFDETMYNDLLLKHN